MMKFFKQAWKLRSIFFFIFLFFGATDCRASQMSEAQLEPLYAPVAGGHIEYYRYGQGSPIVLIPGFATDVSSWSSDFLQELSKEHELIILNNRNVGGSLVNSKKYTTHDLASDVHQLINDLGLKRPSILGISMGGMIAQQIAASYPDQVGRLILINTAISGHKSVQPSVRTQEKLINIPANKLGFYFVALNYFFPPSWRIQMAYKLIVDRFHPHHLNGINIEKIRKSQYQLLMDWSRDETTAKKISRLPMPVLVVNGLKDSVIPPINSNILIKTIPNAQLSRWKNGGHAIIYQYSKPIALVINQFLK